MGDLLIFLDASFEINEPMIFGLNELMVCVVHQMNGSGFIKDSSVVEEQRYFSNAINKYRTKPYGQFYSCIY